MTRAIATKVANLIKTTDTNAPKLRRTTASTAPFAHSAAKYYPALKKLADK